MVLSPFLDSCREALRGGDAAHAHTLERVLARGLPTKRDEDWKYSEPVLLAQKRFGAAAPQVVDTRPWLLPGLDAIRLVFVNGTYRAELSDPLPEGLSMTPLPPARPPVDDTVFSELNAIFSQGWALSLAEGAKPAALIHLLFLHTSAGSMSHSRLLLRLGRGSSLQLIEHYAGGDEEYFCNAHIHVVLGEQANLRHYRLQQHGAAALHVGRLHVEQARDSQLHTHSADLGGLWVRNDLKTELAAPGAQAHLFGVYAPAQRQHIDNHTRIDHRAPAGTSREQYRGILDGHGRGVFNGKIVVHQDAQKTDSEQASAALLLSRTAEVDVKPELEIYADDVKCRHGATVGQLDESAVFYLRSRGLDEAAARSLLTYSFVDEVVGKIDLMPLRQHVEKALLARMPGAVRFAGLLQ